MAIIIRTVLLFTLVLMLAGGISMLAFVWLVSLIAKLMLFKIVLG